VSTMLVRVRSWPGIVAVFLIIVVLLPPAAGYARQYAFAQALQFVIFGVVGPALLALGTPWRTRSSGWPPGSGERSRRPGVQATVWLGAFIAVTIAWRLPATVNALARDPFLAAAEMITLLAVGTGLWLELTSAPHGPGQLPRPARAAMAAAAMWTIWVLAYLTGMSNASWFAAYHHHIPAGGLSAAADQQIAVAILWTVPALCFLPLLYVTVIAWLGSASSAGNERPAASAGWPRPPRGWRSPHIR
jgi:cytochrome c oxidase assembly factor CtaG